MHTKGPWEEQGGEVTGGNGDLIAEVFALDCDDNNRCRLDDVSSSNARLIVAAPELLEALDQIANYPVTVFGYDSVQALKLRMVAMQSIARAAIKKAKGE